jgi:hypothetical protein
LAFHPRRSKRFHGKKVWQLQRTSKTPEQGAEEQLVKRRTLYQSLHLMPAWLGMLLGLLLVLASVPAGNWKALNRQISATQRVWAGLAIDGTPVPKNEQLSMEAILAGRVADAANLLTVMRRYPDTAAGERAELETARSGMRSAGEPGRIRAANAALQEAMNSAVKALYEQVRLTEEDDLLVRQVVDDFNDHGRKLRVRVRDYDHVMQKALDTYNELPSRARFPTPEFFGEL